jgi:DNA-binding transcriptional LysR family regulator
MRLVERRSRGVSLTEAGRILVGHAVILLRQARLAERELAALAGVQLGLLRLACFPTAGGALIPRAARTFQDRYPEVELIVEEAEHQESLPRLLTGELDIAMAYDYDWFPQNYGDDFDWMEILRDPLLLGMHKNHPLAGRSEIDLAEVAHNDWIGGRGNLSTIVLQLALAPLKVEPKVVYEVTDYNMVQGLVGAGLGIALLPRIATLARHPDVVVRPVTGSMPLRRVSAVVPAQRWRAPAVEAMIAILQDTCLPD